MHCPAPARVLPLLLACTAACGDDVDDACALRDPASCDVREAECVEHLHAVVACIRGAEHPLPKIDYYSADEYLAQQPPIDMTPETEQADAQTAAVYKLLSLLPADWAPPTDEPSISAPFIFYDWEKQTITAIVAGTEPSFEVAAMLYTLILADRDAEIGVDARLQAATSFDRKRALITLLSGEAKLYSDLAALRVSDYEAYARDLNYAPAVGFAHSSFADKTYTWAEAFGAFQYYYGADHMLTRYLADGPAGLDRAFEDDADTTASVLLGPGAERHGALADVDAPLPEPPAGFRYLVQDSYGPVMYLIHRARNGAPVVDFSYELALADDWVGDRFLIAGADDSEQAAGVWQIAGPDGSVMETIIVATDLDTEALFKEAFE